VIKMTRRSENGIAEKLSIVLLTRAAFGTTAGIRTAISYGLRPALVKDVFLRPASETRINFVANTRRDRRKTDRW